MRLRNSDSMDGNSESQENYCDVESSQKNNNSSKGDHASTS